MSTATLVAVNFRRHPDVNANRLARFLESIGADQRTIKDVKRGRPAVLSLEWSDTMVRKLSELGHHERLAA